MKISEVYVDRFGVWNDLALASFEPGLNVLYGPNETGKSTLMRFIRGVLYGFTPHGLPPHGRGLLTPDAKGSLRLVHDGSDYEVTRHAPRGQRGTVSLSGCGDGAPSEEAMHRMLSGTSEEMFERLFAVDLLELQELATLSGDELAERVYGLALGPQGQSILDAWSELTDRQRALFNPENNTGRLADLFGLESQLAAEIEQAATLPERHAVLSHERDTLAEDIERRKRRQAGLLSEQRGHRFMQQAWPVWNQLREYRRQQGELPEVSGFPADGLTRLNKLDERLDSHTRCRKTLLAEARQLRADAKAMAIDDQLGRHAAAIEALCDRRRHLADLNKQVSAAEARLSEAAEKRDAALAALGDEWSIERLETADTSPAAQLQLLDAARGYYGRLDRRGRIRRRYKARAAAWSRQARDLNERRKAGGDIPFAQQAEAAKQRIAQLEETSRLRSIETELEQRCLSLKDRLERIDQRPPLPAWAYVVLGFFGILGIVFALVGFYTGLTFNGLMGLMYALLGTACGGTAYALKTHVESTAGENVERLTDQLREVEVQLRQTRSEIARGLAQHTSAPAADQTGSATDLLVEQTRHLAEWERLAALEQQAADRRVRMSEHRQKVRQAQRDVITARHAWCDILKQLGLRETLRIDEAFDNWRDVLIARDAHQRWQAADRQLKARRQPLDQLRHDVRQLAEQLGWKVNDGDDLAAVLDGWNEQLEQHRQQRAERRRLVRDARSRLREANGYRRRIVKCRTRRGALLVQAGAATREEFEERAASLDLRRELDEQIAEAAARLEVICRQEPDLAIAEEDMLAFDPDENRQQLADVETALDDIESELQKSFERLGSVRQELADVEADRRATCLRFNQARVSDELRRAAEEWFALELSSRALENLQHDFERNHQPETLASATKYLTQMTRGRYRNVWTPLGRQRLCVDDERGRSFAVEQLSGGTREQLFLAIRLAIIEDLTRQGMELPMVLDDVFANFDQSRTEAAVETLLDFAAGGQQILLLTCHLHVAQMVEGRGGHAIWLPQNQPVLEERRAG